MTRGIIGILILVLLLAAGLIAIALLMDSC